MRSSQSWNVLLQPFARAALAGRLRYPVPRPRRDPGRSRQLPVQPLLQFAVGSQGPQTRHRVGSRDGPAHGSLFHPGRQHPVHARFHGAKAVESLVGRQLVSQCVSIIPQPLQQFPQGRLQELGALLAHVFLQSLEAPTIRRYSKDSAELLHKLGAHGRPHILSRCGGLCEVSLFSRQVANPAWTASYPQKTLLYPARTARQSYAAKRPPGPRRPRPSTSSHVTAAPASPAGAPVRPASSSTDKAPASSRAAMIRPGPPPGPRSAQPSPAAGAGITVQPSSERTSAAFRTSVAPWRMSSLGPALCQR